MLPTAAQQYDHRLIDKAYLRAITVTHFLGVFTHKMAAKATASGVTMGWLLRLVTGAPLVVGGPRAVLEFLVINFSVCLVLVLRK